MLFSNNQNRKKLFIGSAFHLILFAAAINASCSSGAAGVTGSVRDGRVSADPTNPFPEKILGHRVFLIFRSARQNLLGYSLRPGLEKVQVFGAKYWQGKEKPGQGAGENRTIVFTRKQARRIGAALPGIGFSNSYQGRVSFKLVLKGLRVRQLSVPVLEQEYRDLPEARTSPFVVSLLSADEVLIQALVNEGGGTRVGSRSDAAGVFAGDVKYSESAKGVIAARNTVIGFITSRPRGQDLKRRATGTSFRRLGIFDLEDRTGHADFSFLSSTMRHKLEEAFQSIPRFHVVTERKEDAKFHLKGSYRKIGSRVQFELALKNTYNQKLVHKVVRAVKTDSVDALYDYQLKLVEEFAGKFGVELKAGEKKRLRSVVRQAKNLDRLKEFRLARRHFEKGRFKQCESAARQLTDRAADYLDAWLLHANCILQLSRFRQAEPIVKHALKLALAADNPIALSRAYQYQGWLLVGLNNPAASLRSRIKGLEVLRKAYGNAHPDTADYYTVVGWGRYLAARRAATPDEKTAMLKEAEKEYLYSLNFLKGRYGPGDVRLIPTYGGLGTIQVRLGKVDVALANATMSLNLSKKHLGMSHPWTGRRKNDLGSHYRKLKRFDEALDLYLRAEKVFQRALGDDVNLMRAVNYTSIGILYYQRKQFEPALKYRLLNLRAYKKMFGHMKNHSYVNAAYRRVGNVLLKMNDVRGAVKYWSLGNGMRKKTGWLARYLRGRFWVSARNGGIPKGAMKIGADYNGKDLYACRVRIDGRLYFGKIRPLYGACNYVKGGRELRAVRYRVLVLGESPRWFQVRGSEGKELKRIPRIVDVDLAPRSAPGKIKQPSDVKAPRIKDEFVYLCRVKYQGSTVLGAVRDNKRNVCRFGYGGTAYGSADYELLAASEKSVKFSE